MTFHDPIETFLFTLAQPKLSAVIKWTPSSIHKPTFTSFCQSCLVRDGLKSECK